MKESEAILERIKIALNAKNDSEVAAVMGIKQQSVTSARKRGKIPPRWITKIAQERDISSDWLLFGIGSKKRSDLKESIRPFEEGGLLPLVEADRDFPPNEKILGADSEIYRFYSLFVYEFLEKIYKEIDYYPEKIIKNSLSALVNDELAFKIRPRIINYLKMTKEIEDIDSDRKEAFDLIVKKKPK
ncbi:helix-turn-helix domain-containing protein [uncultured Desulfosarcina sp.]|uniref:helix-turn-helix domain-containing protein n=1 Tax=uncultured Desulfosarcina sp. TaxID=218289 RepID=UPI0029C87E4D|nr:helix-turn-helix domain-containing protein [uncultured Desulfosarcina sp.]